MLSHFNFSWTLGVIAFAMLATLTGGCQATRQRQIFTSAETEDDQVSVPDDESARNLVDVELVSSADGDRGAEVSAALSEIESNQDPSLDATVSPLVDLESAALQNNPTLRRMEQEAAAAADKTRYIAKLPDPSLDSRYFIPPMNFEPDRQVADVQLMQMIPWLSRLKAEEQRACLEALVAENLYQAERLRVIGDLRASWFRLYVLNKQIETTLADQAQLESLIKTANARVATGDAQPGDVLLATLELSSLQEQLISYRQQTVAASADINRLLGRDSATPVHPPDTIDPAFPDWDHELLKTVAFESQPELNAARLRTAATRWGIEVARLRRRPDLTFGIGWIVMDAPGATMPGAGRDSLTLGVSTTLPIWHQKYDAMLSEATRDNFAAHASEDDVMTRLDAMLRDLWEQAEASHKTATLYTTSILPQARQAFEADQKSLVNNTVAFDRVIRDYRTLLNLELGYHRALGQQATTLARIRQTVGVDLVVVSADDRDEP